MTRRVESDSRELSNPAGDEAGQKLREAFAEAERAITQKLKKQFGAEFIHDFARKMRDEVERLPINVTAQIDALFKSRLNEVINKELDSHIRQFWGSFIQNEIKKEVQSPDMIITLAKKIKELM